MFWEDGALRLLDQRELPQREVWLRLTSSLEVAEAIRGMAVRGAPAIGIAAAYGIALAAKAREPLDRAYAVLAASRPTAVNLFWALDRLRRIGEDADLLLAEARAIEAEDLAMNREIGRIGAAEIPGPERRILTICNTGALATAGHGTALGIVRTLRDEGRLRHVWACETRPRQQGLKLTAYELLAERIPFSLIADSAAATVLSRGEADAVIVGADRIAANGDAANKVGTLMLAVLAREFGVPFYVAAPRSTFDPAIPDGAHIPIEERHAEEITHVGDLEIAPAGTPVFNPAFDVTPARYIAGIISEGGVWRP